ncbi:MAG: mannose-1-phosphate guanylyltransferase [Candidatus Dormibacteraceae bacterium]
MYGVVPAGGTGSRLWPRSRRSAPKHVLRLSSSGQPLLRETIDRIRPLAQDVYVVTETRQQEMISSMVPELGDTGILVEPSARGTTNAMGLAALALLDRDPEAVMLWSAADHVIRGARAYREAVERAVRVAEASKELVAIGLKPTYPATGFGYIEAGEAVRFGHSQALRVERFVEKPSQQVAERFAASRRHFWNLSMFCFRCDVFLEELERFGPRHLEGLRAVVAARQAGDEKEAARIYGDLPNEAVDYTVMERTQRLLAVPATFRWTDVGSWTDLAALVNSDDDGNVVEGPAVLLDVHDSFVSAPDKLVAVIGCDELVIVDTDDALLVCDKRRAQDVKKIVERLGETGQVRYL